MMNADVACIPVAVCRKLYIFTVVPFFSLVV